MNITFKLAFGVVLFTVLSACAEKTRSVALTPSTADQSCLTAVAQKTGNSHVSLLSSEFSEAGTLVTVAVGPDAAPWQCIAYRDGATDGIVSLTNEGSL